MTLLARSMSTVTALRAGEQLPLMFAGAQLGITIASLMLGRLGEPAVADLLAFRRRKVADPALR